MTNPEQLPVTYGVVEETYTHQGKIYKSYGIAACLAEDDACPTILASLHDLTPNRDALARLADACTRQSLSPSRLEDVVEDFLSAP